MARPFVASSSGQNGGGGGMAVPVVATAAEFWRGNRRWYAGRRPGRLPRGRQRHGRVSAAGRAAGWFSGGGGDMGGFGGEGGQRGQRGGQQRQMSKDEQDRTIFDGQAITLFSFLLEKIGIDKVKELIKQAQEGKESREYLSKPDVLGSDFEKIEEDWTAWVKAQK